jgi:hypothetical protein
MTRGVGALLVAVHPESQGDALAAARSADGMERAVIVGAVEAWPAK